MTERYTVVEEVQDIARDVINRLFMPEAYYSHEKAPALCNQIVEATIDKLSHQQKLPRKWIAHCTIVQKNGSGLHTVSACNWDANSDGCYAYKAENKAMICVLTVYGVTM